MEDTNKRGPVVDKRVDDNQKRLDSLKSRIDQEKQQKKLVKEALFGSDTKVNKRIVFDLNEEELQKKQQNGIKNKKLFDDSSDEEEDFNFEFKQSDSKKDEKLIELKSKFAHDERFKVDEKFLSESDEDEQNEFDNEKEKNLNVLNQVLGYGSVCVAEKQKKEQPRHGLIIPRYDPSCGNAEQFEVRPEKGEKEAKNQKKRSVRCQLEASDIQKEKLSERYFEVSESLKTAIDNKSGGEEFGFCLANDDESSIGDRIKESDRISETRDKKVKKQKFLQKNPFKYDSSTSEEESEDVKFKKKEPEQINKQQSSVQLNNLRLNQEPFFFTENDARLDQDVFYSKDQIEKSVLNWKKIRENIKKSMGTRKRVAKKLKKTREREVLLQKRVLFKKKLKGRRSYQ